MVKSFKDGRYSVNMDYGSEIFNSLKIWGCWYYVFFIVILFFDDYEILSSFCG